MILHIHTYEIYINIYICLANKIFLAKFKLLIPQDWIFVKI